MENAELKERLGLNSKNSSIPNFKELYKIKKDIAHLKLIGMIDKKAESRA